MTSLGEKLDRLEESRQKLVAIGEKNGKILIVYDFRKTNGFRKSRIKGEA